MKRILLQEPGNFAIADVPVNKEVTAGHAIVKVHCVGICGTDLHAYQGRQPFLHIPGF
jgi:alcohol dehydrogenase